MTEQTLCITEPVGICQNCTLAPCIEVCPAKAISRDERNIVTINEWECNACGTCVKACPYGAIFLDFSGDKWTAVKCDQCMGKPVCVEKCPRNYTHSGE